MTPPLLVLAAWRRRNRPELRDALWRAALWEMQVEGVLGWRPRCMAAEYRGGDVPGLHRPWPLADAELALDLRARELVERLLAEAAEIVDADPEASDLVALEELALERPRPGDARRPRQAKPPAPAPSKPGSTWATSPAVRWA